ncbi:MAG: mechanosensitive ion channel [Gammaproteobacteria bacterium]|nr:mechanosensitive ion channel [Gammaproteobacteria bacterium]MDE0365237.1 mechanosensitive ion channel [Gammaproteobacteria bacterium]
MWEQAQVIWAFNLFTLPGGYTISVGKLATVLLLFAAGYLVSRFAGAIVGRRLSRTKLRPDAIHAIQRIVFFVFLTLIFFVALNLLGIPVTALAFVMGAIAIGVGFGTQNIVNNFISGWILLAERPVRVDDFIEFDTWMGTVERIGNRSTRIRRIDGVHLLVPNSQLLERTVVNWTLIDREIRSVVRVGVAYGSPVRQVSQLILKAVTDQPEVKPDPVPRVVFEDFGDNALVFDAYFWCDLGGDKALFEIRSDIRLRIADHFNEHGVVVAFPQRDIHLDASSPLKVQLHDNARESLDR